MNHNEIKDRLYEFYDGELPQDLTQEIASHTKSCAECAAELKKWEQTAALFLKAPYTPGSEQFVERVMEKITQSQHPAAQKPATGFGFDLSGILQWKVLASLSALLVVLLYSADIQYRSEEPEEFNSVLLVKQTGSREALDQLLFSEKEIGKEDVAQVVFANENNFESEVNSYE